MNRTWKKNENSPTALNTRYCNRNYKMTFRKHFPLQNHMQTIESTSLEKTFKGKVIHTWTNCNCAGRFAMCKTGRLSLTGFCYDFL